MLLGRFRARGSRLILPTLFLAVSAFLLSFLYGRFTEQWQLIALYSVCGLIAFFGFLIPLLRYLTAWTDVTTARVVVRSGLWGQNYRSVSLAQVQQVEQSGSVITLQVQGEEALEIRGLPKSKLVSQEISNLVARTTPASSFVGA
ncbi:MAG: hypothetical protein RJA35_1136 [Actinomycetota bacterium]|jgi:hypothetical protein